MKIFTLLQNLLTMITGQTSRNLTFSKRNAERVTLNANRLTLNVKRLTLNAKRPTLNTVLRSNEPVSQVNMSVQNPMAPINDAFVSVEYKILPVQKKITSVQNIKPVFMQNFFAIVKKIFSLSDRPETLLENLNDGYHPGCHYGTAGTENISGNNLHHDVANNAASFALIPISTTPTAMNQLEKKSVKTITGRSGIFGIMMLMSSLFFVSTAMAQTTYFSRATGAWNSNTTWSTVSFTSATNAGTFPVAGDNVNIGGGFTVTVTADAAAGTVVYSTATTVTSTLAINTGTTLTVSGAVTLARANNNNNVLAVGAGTLNAGSIAFTNGGGTARHFLTISTGTVNVSGNITETGSTTSATITFTGTGLLSVGGSFPTPGTIALTVGTGTIQYSGVAQTISAFTYNNLSLSGSGTKTFTAATPVTNNLSIGGTAIASLAAGTNSNVKTLTLGGNGTIPGTWGSTTSAAANKNNTFFAATTGIVTVSTSSCTPPAAPIVISPVSYCIGATATQLTATGSNLLWYTVSSGGSGSATAPTPVITSVGSTPYFVSQTIGCEGPRAEIDVVVNPTPSTTVNGSSNITCNGANDGTITIAVSGGTPDYFFSVDGGNTYTPITHPSPYIFPGLSANTPYTIRVKDTKGCQSQTF